MLNESFVGVFTKENEEDIPEPPEHQVLQQLKTINFKKDKIRKKLEDLNPNKSPGPDGISPRILKEMADILVDPLHSIFTYSFEKVALPDDWLVGNITYSGLSISFRVGG